MWLALFCSGCSFFVFVAGGVLLFKEQKGKLGNSKKFHRSEGNSNIISHELEQCYIHSADIYDIYTCKQNCYTYECIFFICYMHVCNIINCGPHHKYLASGQLNSKIINLSFEEVL